jgi:hypothetical protein
MLNLPCSCECHQNCHTCGRKFDGPNSVHINCGDPDGTFGSRPEAGSHGLYTVPHAHAHEPWPTEVVDPAEFTEFEREGWGDHGSPA